MSTLRHRPSSAIPPHGESRPPRDTPNKKLSLLRRLTPRLSSGSIGNMATEEQAPMGGSNNGRLSFRSPSRSFRSSRKMAATGQLNLMNWLEADCPHDVLPKILAFCGPQMVSVFARTNRFWRDVIAQESTWRILSEDLYKWKEGDEVPESWKDFYKYNPCVPVDYSSVHKALASASGTRCSQFRSIRVLFRPGKYVLREAITVLVPSNIRVELETMELPTFVEPAVVEVPVQEAPSRRRSSLRNLLCRTADNVEDFEDADEEESPGEFLEPVSDNFPRRQRASLVLRTRRNNEPIIRVRQGFCSLKNLELLHVSHGIDIWNGNSAVQVQPPIGPDEQPMVVLPPPSALLDSVEVTSKSGRGIVNIDGGKVTIKNCYVHDCAATGIYVGGPGSRAHIEKTDVVRNGNGNSQHRRGIARGHSGIYLEQGHASIFDCNVSNNSLTGISAVSAENAFLDLVDSDLISNGTFQLEMPPIGSMARRNSTTVNNNMAVAGLARARSGLVIED